MHHFNFFDWVLLEPPLVMQVVRWPCSGKATTRIEVKHHAQSIIRARLDQIAILF